ncbi:MAG: DUF7619 domain-containing protein, partial [Ignavibacteriaceae bacterium]
MFNFSKFLFAFLLFSFIYTTAQTITSKTSGGNWEDANTWIGGVVPNQNNDVIIDGTVSVTNSNSSCKNLTVTAGNILQNGGGLGWLSLHVNGNLTNNGTIRNNPSANTFNLEIWGSVTNNAEWTNGTTYLPGQSDQYISQASGKFFNCEFKRSDADGYTYNTGKLIASTDLTFKKPFNLQGYIKDVGYYSGSLDMSGKSLTLSGNAQIYYGTVKNAAHLWIQEDAYLDNITVQGATTLHGRGMITSSNVTFDGDLTVADTLQNGGGYGWLAVHVKGNLTNNGVIRNNKYANTLNVEVWGSIINNGEWTNGTTYLPGQSDQYISQASGKFFNCEFKRSDAGGYTYNTGKLIASTDLTFKKSFNLFGYLPDLTNYYGSIDMAGKSLTLSGNAQIYYGTVKNAAHLWIQEDAYLDNITVQGATTLHGRGMITSPNVTFDGDLTVADTLQNGGGLGWVTPIVYGDLINYGTVRNNLYANSLNLEVIGSIYNYGKWKNWQTYLETGGTNRKIRGVFECSLHLETTGNPKAGIIKTDGDLTPITELDVKSGTTLEISGGSTFYNVGTISGWGLIINKGTTVTKRKITTATDYSLFDNTFKIASDSKLDSLTIESYGNQIPFSFSNGVKRWWRIKQFPNTIRATFNSLKFYYSDSELGSNNESSLQVFYSADSGKTWKQLSTSLNVTRNITDNYLTISDVPVEGDYLLSSSADPTSVSPSIITAVIGSSNIRIGAPTRLKIQYVNNSDVAAEDFLITINTGKKVHIKSVEVPLESGGFMSLPKDSLFYANEDTTLVMYALKMAPREERTFDIIVIGDNPALGKTRLSKVLFLDPVSITAAAAITWVAWKAGTYVICKGIDYLGDKAVQGIKMSPEEQKRYDQMVKGGIPTELEQRPGAVKSFAVKTVGTQILKKTLNLAPGGESVAQITYTVTQNVSKVAPSLRQRIFNWFYKETGLYGVETTDNGNAYQPQVSTVTQKKGKLVASWDPNEKVGPNGYGDQMFITSAGKMTYQILFENKKEATAPAYKIAIIDTLRSELDPETVEFGKTSHEGEQYKWNISRTGNILQWEIEGIELPPNIVPPEGEGWVSFTVSPKSGLASGTDLKNKATITFDLNKPITTNEYSNRLDFKPPTTTMNQLAQSINDKSFIVKWKSNDDPDGSGVESSTIFMSVDNGPFNMVGASNSDSLIISAEAGEHKYSFYALAKDFVGNVEMLHPTASTTQVINSVDLLSNEIPKAYVLYQNYPNPFNPSTIIEYDIPKYSDVRLDVFDILGRNIATLVNDKKAAGSYKVEFNASRLASGVYFYRIQAGDFVQAK